MLPGTLGSDAHHWTRNRSKPTGNDRGGRVGERVFLFGSRTRDDLRGGDTDLPIELASPGLDKLSVSLRTGARLRQLIGERRIDVLVTDPQTAETPLIRAARREGIALCVRLPSASADCHGPELRQTAGLDQWRHTVHNGGAIRLDDAIQPARNCATRPPLNRRVGCQAAHSDQGDKAAEAFQASLCCQQRQTTA